MAKTSKEYGNDSIKKLEGPDRVRKRPAVIFGSDGLDGCEGCWFGRCPGKRQAGQDYMLHNPAGQGHQGGSERSPASVDFTPGTPRNTDAHLHRLGSRTNGHSPPS